MFEQYEKLLNPKLEVGKNLSFFTKTIWYYLHYIMSGQTNYFIQSILPNMPTQLDRAITIPTEKIRECEQEHHAPVLPDKQPNLKITIPTDKPILAIIDCDEEQGMSEQSFQLLEKIFKSMQIQNNELNYLKVWPKELMQDDLCANLAHSRTKIVFLIGTLTTQHFLGKDKKISQTQGQIFEHYYQDSVFYFIPLYHPDFISLNSSIKNLTWSSVKNLLPWIKQQLS